MGFVNNLEVLQGNCEIEKQLMFFNILTMYMKTVHLANNDKENVHLKSTKNILCDSVVYENETNENKTEHSASTQDLKPMVAANELNLDSINDNIYKNQEELKQLNNDNKSVMETFTAAFKEISQIPSQVTQATLFSKCYKEFSKNMLSMQTDFSIVKKNIGSEMKIKNLSKPLTSVQSSRPLTEDIKNNLVLAEQVCNLLRKNL